MTMIEEGSRAPAITVQATDGSSVDLASPGRPLVLYFYPKDDTSGCTREAQDFTALAGDFAKAGVKVIGVSRDPMKSHEKFIGKYSLAVPLASDEDGRISDAFGTWVEKSMYGRKYMGMERATYLIGADGRVLKAWRKVKFPNHAQEVLAAARELATA
jgi:peroxiredoxin Q/BCP